MGETEMPPPALPGTVSHLLLWASHSLVCVCIQYLYHRVYHKAVRVYNLRAEVEARVRLPGFKF